MRVSTTVVALVVASLLSTTSAFAQQRHVVDGSALRQAVAAQVSTDTDNRAAVREVLQQPQVRELAAKLGLSVTRAETAVATMNSSDLARAASAARTADASLSGGSNTVIISTTTILLILIIVILLAN